MFLRFCGRALQQCLPALRLPLRKALYTSIQRRYLFPPQIYKPKINFKHVFIMQECILSSKTPVVYFGKLFTVASFL